LHRRIYRNEKAILLAAPGGHLDRHVRSFLEYVTSGDSIWWLDYSRFRFVVREHSNGGGDYGGSDCPCDRKFDFDARDGYLPDHGWRHDIDD
jgi:hypothetical protein